MTECELLCMFLHLTSISKLSNTCEVYSLYLHVWKKFKFKVFARDDCVWLPLLMLMLLLLLLSLLLPIGCVDSSCICGIVSALPSTLWTHAIIYFMTNYSTDCSLIQTRPNFFLQTHSYTMLIYNPWTFPSIWNKL